VADLRSYVFLDSLQPQHAAFLGTVAQGFLPLGHPPGFTALLAVIGRVVGLDFSVGRAVVLAFFAGSCALVGRALWRHERSRVAGLLSAVCAAGCALAGVPLLEGFYDLIREDTMALFLCVLAAALADPAPKHRRARARGGEHA
jgi:hypothetical protein